jgi:carbon-monoxide dehydrogenase catalytic subunit
MQKKDIASVKELNPKDVTICQSTAQMLVKAKKDGVETAFDRAFTMKACPIGAESACCKHCFYGTVPAQLQKAL